ncbi:MAG: hypothetical protein M1823_004660 [Watsoniomyces obsoletus]|nr:MAG: hypothetical protein M1823_004660 [Watsoniomyces obsoletus]
MTFLRELQSFSVVLCISYPFYAYVDALDANYESTLAAPVQQHHSWARIPKVVHFVFVELKSSSWIEYAAVRSARTNIGAEKINIWVPWGQEFPGDIWARMLKIPSVVIRRMQMPDSVYGRKVQQLAHISDVVRLKILYEEGGKNFGSGVGALADLKMLGGWIGIYMDTNLIALRSSDEVLMDADRRSTVMAVESGVGLCNALIMATPRAPFLRRWMEEYRTFDDSFWNVHSVRLPYRLYAEGDPDITVLDRQAWFYPMYGPSNRGMKTMWLGKSWWDIDRSYGVHFWRWPGSPIPDLLSPRIVREIDTPLFCSMRKLFDHLDDDGIVSPDPTTNPNCSIPHVSSLRHHPDGLFAAYDFSTDVSDAKWIDGSGNHLHGWGLSGTSLTRATSDGGGGSSEMSVQHFREGSYAVLPLPRDWDPRVGSVRIGFKVDIDVWSSGQELLLFKTSIDENGAILIKLLMGEAGQRHSFIQFIWTGASTGPTSASKTDDVDIKFPMSLWQFSNDHWHNLTISYDRKKLGRVYLDVNGTLHDHMAVSTLVSQPTAYEIWVAAQDEYLRDFGFRGTMRHLYIYSKCILSDVIGRTGQGNWSRVHGVPDPAWAAHTATIPILTHLLLFPGLVSLMLAFLLYFLLRWRRRGSRHR